MSFYSYLFYWSHCIKISLLEHKTTIGYLFLYYIAICILFDLPRETHRYFIEPISNVPHIKTVLWTRFVQFVTSLSNCHKLCIRLLVDLSKHDLRTVLCKNLESIAQDCIMCETKYDIQSYSFRPRMEITHSS